MTPSLPAATIAAAPPRGDDIMRPSRAVGNDGPIERASRPSAWTHAAARVALAATLLAPARALAQGDTTRSLAEGRAFWLAGAGLVLAGIAFDRAAENASLATRTHALDDLRRVGNALGTGRNLMPVMGAGFLVGWLGHLPRVRDAAIESALAYVAGNIAVDIGKPLVGRHRPDTTGSPWRFHPFSGAGEFHSTPSAHTLHAFTIASALATEIDHPLASVALYGAATIVGWSRVYADEHWTSDVALSAVLGTAIGRASVRFVHRRTRGHSRFSVAPWGRGASVRFVW